jgi:hypothetical protein
MPTKETTNPLSSRGTLRENFPWPSVATEMFVFFTVTVAPANGLPSSSVTNPEIVLLWAKSVVKEKMLIVSISNFLLKYFFIIEVLNFKNRNGK